MSMVMLMFDGEIEDWGIIPSFLDEADPRPAREQFDEKYIAGWHPFKGHWLDPETLVLTYPGDPPLSPLAGILFREETLILYPGSWVVIRQDDTSWEIARMD